MKMHIRASMNHPKHDVVIVIVEMSVVHPGYPGRLCGPPEKCYPPEPPEFEVGKIFIDERGEEYDGEEVEANMISEEEWDRIYDCAIEVEAESRS